MKERTSCPEPNRLRGLLDGVLSDHEESQLNLHLEACEECGRRLDGLVGGAEAWPAILRNLQAEPPTREPALEHVVKELKGRSGVHETQEHESRQANDEDNLNFLSPSGEPGQLGRLGHYEVIEVVGRGGMGVVLKAFDSSLRRVVAIKVLARHLSDNAAARKRFTREAQAAAAVSHDHIVTIHAVEAANNPPFIVMQFVEGKSLQERIDLTGPLELKEILRIGMQTAAGLGAAHAQGLVHRDIKPANILLENGIERVKITDFGLARAVDDASLTNSGVVAGTPLFMAPSRPAVRLSITGPICLAWAA